MAFLGLKYGLDLGGTPPQEILSSIPPPEGEGYNLQRKHTYQTVAYLALPVIFRCTSLYSLLKVWVDPFDRFFDLGITVIVID